MKSARGFLGGFWKTSEGWWQNARLQDWKRNKRPEPVVRVFAPPYRKLIMRFFASFQISSGHASLNFAFRALTSSIFAWSQSITPVVCVRPSNSI